MVQHKDLMYLYDLEQSRRGSFVNILSLKVYIYILLGINSENHFSTLRHFSIQSPWHRYPHFACNSLAFIEPFSSTSQSISIS
jgi:hypothetical protein